jgi:pimeloyl-ACP methyl ester carboxylesterase
MALASPRHGRWRSEAEPAAESTALFPNTKLVMQPGGGHPPWLDDPEWFVSAVSAFLDDDSAPARC